MCLAGLTVAELCINLEVSIPAETESILHVSRCPSEHLVEDVIGALLSRLRADARLLQKVVGNVAPHDFKLREGRRNKGGGGGGKIKGRETRH